MRIIQKHGKAHTLVSTSPINLGTMDANALNHKTSKT